MTDRPTCKTCRHWVPTSAGEGVEPIDGECRIRAPQFRDGYTRACWPTTAPDSGCSEHALIDVRPAWKCLADDCSEARPHVHMMQFTGGPTIEYLDP